VDAHQAAAAVDELDEALPQGRVFERLPTVLLKKTASKRLRLSGWKTAGSLLISVSNAPVWHP